MIWALIYNQITHVPRESTLRPVTVSTNTTEKKLQNPKPYYLSHAPQTLVVHA